MSWKWIPYFLTATFTIEASITLFFSCCLYSAYCFGSNHGILLFKGKLAAIQKLKKCPWNISRCKELGYCRAYPWNHHLVFGLWSNRWRMVCHVAKHYLERVSKCWKSTKFPCFDFDFYTIQRWNNLSMARAKFHCHPTVGIIIAKTGHVLPEHHKKWSTQLSIVFNL